MSNTPVKKVTDQNSALKKVGLISFFSDISSEFLYPITPIFLSTILGASVFSIGIIEGCAEASASLLQVFSGRWSDQIKKRKPFIWLGYLLAAVAKPITGLSYSWESVLFGRVCDRAGKGIRTPARDALIAEVVAPEDLGRAFGYHRAMDTLGAVLGPLLAVLYLYFFKDHLRSLYFLALFPGLISVWISFKLPESPEVKEKYASKEKIGIGALPKQFLIFVGIWGIFTIANSNNAFILLRAQQSGLSSTYTVLLYSFFNVIYAGGSYPLGALSDKIKRKTILILGLFLFAVCYIGFAFASAPLHFWILFGLYGMFMAMTDGVGKAFAVDLIPPHLKATAIGLLGAVTGITTLIASITAGFLWDHVSPASAFLYGAMGAGIAACALIIFKETPINKPKLADC